MSVILTGIFSFVFAFYGPIEFVKVSWITSSMTTLSNKWLAYMIYDEQTINKVLNENRTEYLQENSDPALINISCDKSKEIELVDVSTKKFQGYLLRVYNPSKVRLVSADNVLEQGNLLYQYVDRYNARAAINGSGFADASGHSKGGVPTGIIMIDKKVIFSDRDNYDDVIALDNDGKLILGSFSINELKNGNIKSAVSFKPALIINGKKTKVYGDGGWGIAPRTAIGQTADGTILLLVIDGRQISSLGATILDLQDIFEQNGAINASALDGGSSTIMMLNGKNVNYPCTSRTGRFLPTAVIVEK